MNVKGLILFLFSFLFLLSVQAQSVSNDTAFANVSIKADTTITRVRKDSVIKKMHDPRVATRHSVFIPGWGQAYNHQYWKIPLVYIAIGIPTYTFIINTAYYKETNFAFNALWLATYGSNPPAPPSHSDSAQLYQISDPVVRRRVLSGEIDLVTLQTARNTYRKNREYSIMWFLIAWGLNVADAAVSGHLRDFNVSDDLSLHISPTFIPEIKAPGINLVLNINSTPKRRALVISAR